MACQESRLPIGKFNLRQEQQSNGDTIRISVLVYMAIQYGMYKTSTATGDLPKHLGAMRTVTRIFCDRDDFKIDCRDGCTIQTKVEGSLQKQTLYWREKRT